MSRQDRIIALIRTYVPALVGALLAFVIAHVPAVAQWIATADSLLAAFGYVGVSVTVLLQAVLVALVIGLYYWLARKIGSKWPGAEKWLLGHSATPSYATAVTIPVHGVITPDGIQVTTHSGTVLGTVPMPKTEPPKYGS